MKVSNKNKIFGQDNTVDVLIIVFSLFALFASIYYFTSGIRRELVPGSEITGKIRHTGSAARIRADQDLVWNPVRRQDLVRQNDFIVAGKDSEVIVELNGRGILRVSPGSMIQVTTNPKKGLSISILKGSVGFKAKNTQPLNFRVADKDVALELTVGRISVSQQSKNVQIAVYDGKAVLEDGRTLESQSLLNLGENKTQKKLGTSFLYPENDEFTYLESPRISFQTAKIPEKGGFLWISEDEDFQKKTIIPWTNNTSELVAPLDADGKIFFKFVASDGSDDSLTYNHTFRPWSSPVLSSPLNGTITSSPISLSWSLLNRLPFKNYIQIATDEKFKKIVLEEMADNDSFEATLVPGRYFWRVGTKEAGLMRPWSHPGRFRVIGNADENLELKSARDRYPLINGIAHVDLQINGESTGNRLTLVISDETKELRRVDLATKHHNLDFTKVGKYKLQIIDFDQENVEIGISSPLEIIIVPHKTLPPPRLRNEDYKVEFEDLTSFLSKASRMIAIIWDSFIPVAHSSTLSSKLEWDQVVEAKEYLVEIYSDQKKSQKITEFRTGALEQTWKPKESGVFFWRVTAIDEFGIPGVPSPMGRISFMSKFSSLPGPKIEKGLYTDQKIQIELSPVERAGSYEIELKVVDEADQVLDEKKLEIPDVRVNQVIVVPANARTILLTARGVSRKKKTLTQASDSYRVNIEYSEPPAERSSKLTPSDRLLVLNYQRLGMGSKWNDAAKDLKGVSGKSQINFLSLRYFQERKFKFGPGIDGFYILDGSVRLQGLAASLQSSYVVWEESKFKLEPLVGLFTTPYHKQGLYGARLEFPIHYKILPTWGIFLGIGYVYGRFYGIEKVKEKVDLNVPFSNMSAYFGVVYSGF